MNKKNITVLFQNPDTLDSIEIKIENKNYYIRDIAEQIIDKFNLKSPPIFFTIFKDKPTENQYLEENDKLIDVLEKRLDEKIPIWWRSSDLNEDIMYNLRVNRFIKSGYKIDIIKNKNIMIVGIGLLGSEIALHCATIGIKNITVIDYGSVDWYNIYRQPLYTKNDVFKRKVDVAKNKLESIGGINVNSIYIEIPNFNSLNIEKDVVLKNINILEKAVEKNDIIITSLDTFSARMIIQILALVHNKILINTAAGLIGGIIQIIRPFQDPCIGCGTFYDRNQETGACTLASFGTPKIIAGLCIDVLLDLIENRKIEFNYLKFLPNYTIETKTFFKADNCQFCGENGIASVYNKNYKKELLNWLFNNH
ncbi:MAG: ThiF family adenylyltransferase [Candidatus Helarchaeota archaeon]